MYNFNEDVEHGYNPGGGQGMFAPNTKVRRMNPKPDSSIRFRLLPAHDPEKMVRMPDGSVAPDPAAWLPFRSPDAKLNAWGRKIYTLQCVGHGPTGKGSRRRDFISLMSFSGSTDGGGEVYCPLKTLIGTVMREPQWQYLTKDEFSDPERRQLKERKTLGRSLGVQLLCNVVDISDVGSGIQLGIFSSTAYDSLLNKKKGGIACRQNFNVPPQMLAQNPLLKWAYGDITDPNEGPVFVIQKDGTGQFDGYVVNAEEAQGYGLVRFPLDASYLHRRYNLFDLSTVIPRPSEEDVVQGLVQCLDGFSPSGVHEYELLRHVFGAMFKIPDPPSKGSSPGMGRPPQGRQQAEDDVDDEFTLPAQPTTQTLAQQVGAGMYQQPPRPASQPVQQPPPYQPAQQPQFQQQYQQAPAPMPPLVQPQQNQYPPTTQMPQGVPGQPGYQQPPQQPGQPVHLPGDPVAPLMDRNAVMAKLQQANSNRPKA